MLTSKQEVQLSKYMSLILRHTPEEYGILLDARDGSCTLEELVHVLREQKGWSQITEGDIRQVVAQSDKQRFEINEDRIKARYGHSHTQVQYEQGTPPEILYHGTHEKALPLILEQGLLSMNRQYVHLSASTHFAELAGKRRGKLVLLQVDTVRAIEAGVTFYFAGHEVWLSDHIPAHCLTQV
ncbi:RNA 2'-phosphotransferase [Paenibacillus kyungheensis]